MRCSESETGHHHRGGDRAQQGDLEGRGDDGGEGCQVACVGHQGGANRPHPGYYYTVDQPCTSSGIALKTSDSQTPDQDPWADAISIAAAHVETEGSETDGRRGGEESPTGRKFLLVAAGVLFTASVAFGVRQMSAPKPAGLPVATQAADLRLEASALIEQIEAFRTERGELPDPALLSPYLDEGYEYHVVDREAGRYMVRRTAGGVTVTYDGSLPLELWMVIGGSSGRDPS